MLLISLLFVLIFLGSNLFMSSDNRRPSHTSTSMHIPSSSDRFRDNTQSPYGSSSRLKATAASNKSSDSKSKTPTLPINYVPLDSHTTSPNLTSPNVFTLTKSPSQQATALSHRNPVPSSFSKHSVVSNNNNITQSLYSSIPKQNPQNGETKTDTKDWRTTTQKLPENCAFSIEGKLASGTQGKIYQVREKDDSTLDYVVKIQENNDTFRNEVRLLNEGHDYMPDLIESGSMESGKLGYIIMEKLDGTLYDYMDYHKQQNTYNQVCTDLANVIIHLLKRLYETNIRHVDLNPWNIMFKGNIENNPGDLTWKIIDYGQSVEIKDDNCTESNDGYCTEEINKICQVLMSFDFPSCNDALPCKTR